MRMFTAVTPILSALLFGAALASCGQTVTGPTTVVERAVKGYSVVEIASGFEAEIRLDTVEGVSIEAPEGAMSHIITRVAGDRLVVELDDLVSGAFSPRRVIVHVRTLRGVAASGGTTITGAGTFGAESFTIDASGGSIMTLDLATSRTDVSSSGGSIITLRGHTDVLDASYSGGGRFNGYDFPTRTAGVEASGGSRVDVRAAERLEVDASGGSNVYYKGHPIVASDLSGGSHIYDAN
jgi:hypothetical protein